MCSTQACRTLGRPREAVQLTCYVQIIGAFVSCSLDNTTANVLSGILSQLQTGNGQGIVFFVDVEIGRVYVSFIESEFVFCREDALWIVVRVVDEVDPFNDNRVVPLTAR